MIRSLTFGRYADANFGGLERYVFQLAQSLRGSVEFTNIVARRHGGPDVEVIGRTIYARPLVHLGGTPVCPSMPLHALREHRRAAFDIVHLQFPADPMAHLSSVVLPRSVARVITWHSDIVRQQRLLRLYEPFLRRLIRSANAIIVPTPAHFSSSTQLARWARSELVHVVPFGLDYSRFHGRPPRASEIRRTHGERFLIFTLGRHVYYKGFEYLIRAMKSVDGVLMIGGRGPLTEELKGLCRTLEVEERVQFLDRIPDSELPAYYHACDVFCLPSIATAEAFGLVQLEAMACGKPVICCQLGNGVNWVNVDGVTGLAVPPRDSAALARVLQLLKDDEPLRQRIGAAAREHALSRFSSDAMARGTLDVYRKVLGRSPSYATA